MRAFLTLVEYRNFTKAAKAFCLSQPAFSAMVRSTETTLGVELVDRSSPQFQLTSAGEHFAEIANTSLAHFDRHIREFQARSLATEIVTIAAMVTLSYGFLPPILADFQSKNSKAQLDLRVAHPLECIELVNARKADFAVTAIDSLPSHLFAEHLFREPFELLCRSDHPLASLHQIELRHLTAYPFVHYGQGRMTRRLIDAALYPDQLQLAHEVDHIHTIRALVESGGGISVIPVSLRQHFVGSALVLRPIANGALSRDIALVFHRTHPPSPMARSLATHIREVALSESEKRIGSSES